LGEGKAGFCKKLQTFKWEAGGASWIGDALHYAQRRGGEERQETRMKYRKIKNEKVIGMSGGFQEGVRDEIGLSDQEERRGDCFEEGGHGFSFPG